MADLNLMAANGFELDLRDPLNPALTQILNGNQMRAFVLAGAQRMKMLYIEHVHRGDPDDLDHLYASASAFTEKTFTSYGPRWSGVLEIDSGHVLPWEFGFDEEGFMVAHHEVGHHDLNYVLERISV
ncbi:MAG TPA: hypothetical protein VJ777_18480 [Mycobacterium sp.]|nr:hypothetical protein [Mycobacterium sp.]